MAKITIRVSDNEKAFLKYMSNFLGLSVSEMLKRYSFDDLEYIYDSKVGDEALLQYRETGKKSLEIEKVMEHWEVD